VRTTPGQLIVNDALPDWLQDHAKTLTADETENLLGALARRDPDKYREISHKLTEIGRNAAFDESATLSLSDMQPNVDRAALFAHARQQTARIQNDKDLSKAQKQVAIAGVYGTIQKAITDENYATGRANENPFALQVLSKARGSAGQLAALQASPGSYTDPQGNIIPVFVSRSFAEGLRPHEYWAGSFGARQGVVSTKFCLHEDTSVLLQDYTAKSIKDLLPGDDVWTVDANDRLLGTKVSAVCRTGVKPCYTWEFGPGKRSKSVTATVEHTLYSCFDGIGRLVMLGEVFAKKISAIAAVPDATGNRVELLHPARQSDVVYAETVDIEVEHASHMFVLANGLIVGNSTRDAGDLGKQFNQASMRTVVTADDCGTLSGIPVKAGDRENIGAELAQAVGKYPAGTVVTKEVMADLAKTGKDDEIVVRSPMSCGQTEGVCKHCVGLREDGNYPKLGDHVGITASSALAERIAQGSLNTKHCLPLHYTPVRKTNGLVADISELVVGDEIYGLHNGKVAAVRVLALIDQGVQHVRRYHFGVSKRKPGRQAVELLATPDHKVRSASGLAKVADADTLAIPRACEYDGVNEPLAFFAGFYLGDGIRWAPSPDGGELRVSCADNTLAAQFVEYLHPFNLDMRKRARSHDYAIVMRSDTNNQDKSTGRMLPGLRNRAKQLIDRLGWRECYAHTKLVPPEVWSWDRESVAQFVSGFVTADGSVYPIRNQGPWGISFSSCHKELLQSLWQLLVLRLGVRPTVLTRIGIVKAGGIRKHDQWQFVVGSRSEVVRLARQLHLKGAKALALAEAQAAYRDVIVDDSDIVLHKYADEPVGDLACMDITVDSDESLFALASGAIVKNSGGMTSADGKKKDLAGFDIINQLFQVPKQFAHSAAVAAIDGEVERITPAPQGGTLVYVNGQAHHVLPENEASVQVGDKVEAGDQISDGLLNPRDVLEHKGVGEARRYLAERATKAFRDSGYAVHRRNMELLVRGVINHAELDDDSGPYMIGDVVDYSSLAATYKPREDSKTLDINAAVGQYLEQPVLHHTIGTRITDRIVKQLRKHGHSQVTANIAPPPFKPRSFGLRAVPQQEKDWMAQLGSSHLTKNLLKNVHRGAESNLRGLHPVPAMAKSVDIGRFVPEGVETEEKRIL